MIAGITAVLTSSLIWATVIFYYKKLMRNEGYLLINLKRVSLAMLLSLPIMAFKWDTNGAAYSILSGVLGLGIGDSLYLYAILRAGASVAAPVAYTYVLLSQFAASLIGEAVGPGLMLSAVLAFLGISSISLNERKEVSSPRGVAAAFLAGVSWMMSSIFIKKASVGEGASVYAIAFFRLLGATFFLGTVSLLHFRKTGRVASSFKQGALPLAFVSFTDMFIGATLFALGISVLGVSRTVIFISLSPVITVILARIFRLEQINRYKAIGTLLIISGIVLSSLT